jgi:hypothetical protein
MVSGLYPLSENLNTRQHNVLILDLIPSSGEGRESPTLLGPLNRANLSPWTTHVKVSVILRLIGHHDQFFFHLEIF